MRAYVDESMDKSTVAIGVVLTSGGEDVARRVQLWVAIAVYR